MQTTTQTTQTANGSGAGSDDAGSPLDTPPGPDAVDTGALVAEELLVEEVSIDGMCGVY